MRLTFRGVLGGHRVEEILASLSRRREVALLCFSRGFLLVLLEGGCSLSAAKLQMQWKQFACAWKAWKWCRETRIGWIFPTNQLFR